MNGLQLLTAIRDCDPGEALAGHQSAEREFDCDSAAERLSANCFFNALLRETGAGHWSSAELTPPAAITSPAIRIALPHSGGDLWLSVGYRSHCGRHQFALPIYWRAADGEVRAVTLAEAARAVAAEPDFFPQADKDQRQRFVARTEASMRNMAQALRARAGDFAQLFGEPLDFHQSEQALFCGHSIHPTPKSREPFTDEDAARYAPEFGNHFELQWLAVSPARLRGASGCAVSAGDFAQLVWGCDCASGELPQGYLPVPAHPWQWRRLRRDARVAELLEAGEIRELGSGGGPWRATSSLRAIYGAHSPYMLKFSLSLRLTNSLRTLLPKEMARGLEVPQVRNTPVGRELANRYPYFQVLAEPAYLMLADRKGEPITESLVLFRENPFLGGAAKNVCLLATLTQDHPSGEACRAAQLVAGHARGHQLGTEEAAAQWFARFLDVLVEPLLIAQADYGLLFGAHQQNLILAFERELPKAGYFRDCQGSGYSHLGESLLKPWLPNLAADSENVIDDRMANRLFAYYLIVNSCFGLISALGASGLVGEQTLLAQLRRRLEQLHAGPRRDHSCLHYLLRDEELWAKGNFHCAIVGMNETTAADPLAIYHRLPNPLFINPATK